MKKGGLGWVALAGYVAAYDYWACKKGHETLSRAFGRAMTHRYGRVPTLVMVTVVGKHLLLPKVLPKADPLNYIAERWRFEVNGNSTTIIVDGIIPEISRKKDDTLGLSFGEG